MSILFPTKKEVFFKYEFYYVTLFNINKKLFVSFDATGNKKINFIIRICVT